MKLVHPETERPSTLCVPLVVKRVTGFATVTVGDGM